MKPLQLKSNNSKDPAFAGVIMLFIAGLCVSSAVAHATEIHSEHIENNCKRVVTLLEGYIDEVYKAESVEGVIEKFFSGELETSIRRGVFEEYGDAKLDDIASLRLSLLFPLFFDEIRLTELSCGEAHASGVFHVVGGSAVNRLELSIDALGKFDKFYLERIGEGK